MEKYRAQELEKIAMIEQVSYLAAELKRVIIS